MNFLNKTNRDSESQEIIQFLHVIKDDSIINKKIIQLLKLDSFQRRNVLNRWLEQLRRKSASENLRQALSFLFDDNIAKKVLTLINNNHH